MQVLIKNNTTNAFELQEITPGGGTEIPAGVIVMWSGSIANIPSGWALCNGLNGTPNLVDRFILGTATTPGATGGTATHTHTDHTVTQPTAHTTQTIKYGSSGTSLAVLKNANNHSGVSVSAHNDADHRPPFYTLAFIIKI